MWHFAQWSFDTDTRSLKNDVTTIELTPKQAELLDYFLSNQNQVLSRDAILNNVWQGRIVSDDTITNHVAKLRKLLRSKDNDIEYIKTLSKKGYVWLIEPIDAENFTIVRTADIDNSISKPSKIIPRLFIVASLILITLLVVNLSKYLNEDTPVEQQITDQKSIRIAIVPFSHKNIAYQNGLLKALALIFKSNNAFTVLDFSNSQLNQLYFDNINTFKKVYELDYIIGPNLITDKINSIVLQDSQSVIWQFDQLDKLSDIEEILRMQTDLISHFPAAKQPIQLIPNDLNNYQWQGLLESSSTMLGSNADELSKALNQVMGVISETKKNAFSTQLLFELISRAHWFTAIDAEQLIALLNKQNTVNQFSTETDQYTHLYLAMKYLIKQDDLEAKKHLEIAYQTMPNNNEVNRLLGQVYLNLGYPVEANQYFTKVYRSNPIDQLNFVWLLISLDKQGRTQDIDNVLNEYKQFHGNGKIITMYQAKLLLESTGEISKTLEDEIISTAYQHPFALTIELLIRYSRKTKNLTKLVRYAKEKLTFNQHTAFLFAEYLFMGGYQSEFFTFYEFYQQHYGNSTYYLNNQQILASYAAILTQNHADLIPLSEKIYASPDKYLAYSNLPIILLNQILLTPNLALQQEQKNALNELLNLLTQRGYKNWQMSLAKAGVYSLNNDPEQAALIIEQIKNSNWIWRNAWFIDLNHLKIENN